LLFATQAAQQRPKIGTFMKRNSKREAKNFNLWDRRRASPSYWSLKGPRAAGKREGVCRQKGNLAQPAQSTSSRTRAVVKGGPNPYKLGGFDISRGETCAQSKPHKTLSVRKRERKSRGPRKCSLHNLREGQVFLPTGTRLCYGRRSPVKRPRRSTQLRKR